MQRQSIRLTGMVIFGRPKGDRGSYIQHREGGIAPQVVFEVLSPDNRAGEMRRKLAFSELYGVKEYSILDPDRSQHPRYLQRGDVLEPIAELFGWTSPRLGIRFAMTDRMPEELRISTPDGRPFELLMQVSEQRDAHERRAKEQADRADQEQRRALGLEPEA